MKALVDEGNEIAEELDLSAGHYHEAEEYAVGVTKDYVVAATAIRPYPARTRRGCRGARSGRRRRGVGRRISQQSAAESRDQTGQARQATEEDLTTSDAKGKWQIYGEIH